VGDNAIDQWRRRLKEYINAGGHFKPFFDVACLKFKLLYNIK